MIAEILAIEPARRSSAESRLLELFPELPGYKEAASVLLYANAFPEEIDTRPLMHVALEAGKRLLCPRVERSEHRLRLFEIRSPAVDFEQGILGIPEPRDACVEVDPRAVDWILVPGLVFDERCYRVGRGGGFYDRLLPQLRPDCPRWALVFDCQVMPQVPLEPHDAPLDGVATPSRKITRA